MNSIVNESTTQRQGGEGGPTNPASPSDVVAALRRHEWVRIMQEAADLIEQQAERIKQLVELCRLQHVALIELSPCMYKECQQVQKETQDHAIAAFNKFEGGE